MLANEDALKLLYMQCFTEETPESTNAVFATLLKNSLPVVRYNNEIPVSMLFLIEEELILFGSSHPVYYLYAACTHPEYRGKGIMHELLIEAKQVASKNGKQGIFLRPATSSLVNFYTSAGYIPYFIYQTFDYELKADDKGILQNYHEVKRAQEYQLIRNRLLPKLCDGFVNWNAEDIKAALDSSSLLGGGAYTDNAENPSTLLLYEQDEQNLFIRELLYKTNSDKTELLTFLLLKTGYKKATVRTISDETGSELFGMMYTENEALISDKPFHYYQGLAFD